LYLTLIFFFSSRRRHTISKRDWSSDVCSSDLVPPLRSSRLSRTSSGDISKCAWKRLHLRCSKPFIYAAIAVPLNGSFTDPVNKRFNAQSRRGSPYTVCGGASPRSRWAAFASGSRAYPLDSLRCLGRVLPWPVSESPGCSSVIYRKFPSRPRVIGTYTLALSNWPTPETTRAISTVAPCAE